MILKNNKRIDGCSDTVPIGTLNPFLGLTAPYGYLICQGQKVSKITYKELYEICGDTFGQSTDTEFYLPDLRGQTIAGYKEGDSTFGTLGGLIGSLTHLHSTGNHTLTVDEMPSHGHVVSDNCDTGATTNARNALQSLNNGTKTGWGTGNPPFINNTGGSQPHNHGNTSSASSVQPTIVLNWIVKAFQLMPNQSYVENSLESDSTINSLSAAKGKELYKKFTDCATKSEMAQYLPLSGGTINGNLILSGEENVSLGILRAEKIGSTDYTSSPLWTDCPLRVGALVAGGHATYNPGIGFVEYQEADGTLYMRSRRLFWASSAAVSGYLPEANKGYEIIHTGNRETLLYCGNWVNGTERPTLDSINGKVIYKKYVTGNFNGLNNVALATGVDQYINAEITVQRGDSTQWHRANAHVMALESATEPLSHIDCIFQDHGSIMTYTNNVNFTNAQFRGFIYYTKL